MTDYDMTIHNNPDAMAWAKFFVETTKDMDRSVFEDEGYMVGWFANAMMAMHDHVTGTKTTVLDDGSAFVVGWNKMSIPFYFDVYMPDIRVFRNQRIGTISYGRDLNDRNVWVNYFKSMFADYEEEFYKREPWFPDFDSIVVNGHTIKNVELLDQSEEDIERRRIKKVNYDAYRKMQDTLKCLI